MHETKNDEGTRRFACLLAVVVAAKPTSEVLSTHRPGSARGATNATLRAALRKPMFPGVALEVQERCVDMEGSVCLHRGELEWVACIQGTKEHESIVMMDAKPMHIHAALLLPGAKPGSPATRKQLEDHAERWIDVPPSGGPVDVLSVLEGQAGGIVEHPIGDRIAPSNRNSDDSSSVDKEAKFPTHTLLFPGSVLYGDGPGPRRYSIGQSGNVTSLSTFGYGLLCLPATQRQDHDALMWQMNATNLPAIGSNVTLRLRPRILPAAKAAQADQSLAGMGYQ